LSERIYRMDPSTVNTTAQITIETGWVVPGSPQEDWTLQNVVARAAYAGAHGATVRIATNYGANQTAKTYSAADVLAAVANNRYDLWPEPRDMPARAVKLLITETSAVGEAMQSLNVTFEMVRNGGKLSQSYRQQGRK
jgi:hypothetical protein